MDRDQINTTVKDFFDGWNLYKKVVDSNAMSHQEMYQATKKALQDKFAQQSFSILDLGCGDAAYMAKVLSGFNVSNYVGVDLSKEATALALQNLQFMSENVAFVQRDFLEVMQEKVNQHETFDVVFTSYALHHYTNTEKQVFFNLAKSLLRPNGIVIVIDVVLAEEQEARHFAEDEIKFLSTSASLTTSEVSGLSQHILNCDIPETIGTYKYMVATSGLDNFKVICDTKYYKLFVCNG